MASKTSQRVRSHLQARIMFTPAGGTEINLGSGRLQSFDADHDYGAQPVHGVGDYEPVEHVFLKFNGTITLEAFMLRVDDMLVLGIAALGNKILEMEVLDVKVADDTGLTMRIYRKCTIQRYRESIREGQICGENATLFFITSDKGDPTNKGADPADANAVNAPPAGPTQNTDALP